ncbi:M16 family metallopeptidase [Desulfovermiculus halophilus]|jgi:zinc protease|uniref:M16 family metallopeptidase n=1 Tax=Desulfovermiculus halophilus TaxID=339722 RepID=UPI000687A436|nr:M16 family metallopeptidase [Desulfovermiculus halophilus]
MSAQTPPTEPIPDDPLTPTLATLPNGLQVLALQDHRFPLIAMRLYIHAGAAYERDEEAGISHLLEHMAFKGEAEVANAAQRIEDVGGALNAATGYDHTVYMVDVPSSEWALGLEVLADLGLNQGEILEDELETEKQVVLSELERNQDHPRARMFELLQQRVWAGTPYQRPVIGYRETIQGFAAQDIRDYLDRLYHPQAMLLVVCGDFQPRVLSKQIMDQFGTRFGTQAVLPRAGDVDVGNANAPGMCIERTSWNKAYLGIGFLTPGMNSVWTPALEVLSYILGGHRSSRWYMRYKEELGVVDDISVESIQLEGAGMLLVQVQMEADQVLDFWKHWVRDLAALPQAEFTSEELERAKLNLEDGLLQTKETLAGLCSKLGYFQFFDGQVQAEERYVHQLQRISARDMQETIQGFLRPDRLQACCILPEQTELTEADFLSMVHGSESGNAPEVSGRRTRRAGREEPRIVDVGTQGKMVVQVDRTLPYTALDLSFLGGDMLISPQEQGLSFLLAKTLMRGTAAWNAARIQSFLSSRAASLNAHAGRDQLAVASKFPSRFTGDMTGMISEILARPAFGPEDTAKAVAEQQAQIAAMTDHPMGTLSREVFPFLFPGHFLGYYMLGRSDELSGYTPDRLSRLWARQKECPWVLSVCGDCDPKQFEEWAATLPGQAQADWQAWKVPAPRWNEQRTLHLPLNDRQQAHLLVVFPIPGLAHASNAAISLLKKILAGQNGILFRELRDRRGLGYTVAPMLWRIPQVGFLAFYIGTTPGGVEPAKEGFAQVVDMVQEGQLTDRDLIRAQRLLEVEYYRERQALGGRCGEAADLLIYDLGLDYFQSMLTQSRGTKMEEIQAAAREYLDWDRAYSIVLSD